MECGLDWKGTLDTDVTRRKFGLDMLDLLDVDRT